jgi:hypothetical protein
MKQRREAARVAQRHVVEAGRRAAETKRRAAADAAPVAAYANYLKGS